MRKIVGQVEEERTIPVVVDELDGFVRVAARQRPVIDRSLDHVAIPHQRDVPVLRLRIVVSARVITVVARHGHLHVVGKRQTVPVVEPLTRGQELRQVSQVPLADDPGGIAPRLHQFGDRDLVERQPLRGVGREHTGRSPTSGAVRAAPHGQPPGQQRGAAGRAHGLDVEIRPLLPLSGHCVQTRRPDVRAAERAEVAVAEIVGEDDDDVRESGRLGAKVEVTGKSDDHRQQDEREREPSDHGAAS